MTYDQPLAAMMGDVAKALLPEPNSDLSRPREGVLKFGKRGSLEVNIEGGWFHDYECGAKGGVLELVMHKAGLQDKASAFRWLEEQGIKQRDEPKPAAKTSSTFYDYHDENGNTVFRVERRLRGTEKEFWQHGPDGNGGFVSRKGCMQGVKRVLYRLPDLLSAEPASVVFYCEGEKDVDRLRALGFTATTHPGGAGKFDAVRDGIKQHLAGRRIVLLEDNDEAGREHAAKGLALLRGIASECAVLSLPNLPAKGDVSDWLDQGNSAFELEQAAETALLDRAGASEVSGEDQEDDLRPVARKSTNTSRPVIEVEAGELHNIASEGEEALIQASAPFYSRSGNIVRPVIDDLPAAHGRRTKVARLKTVSVDSMVDHLSRSAQWMKFDGRKKRLARTDPPRVVAQTILARDGEWQFPRLAGVITTPTLRPDGTILSEPGYDPATQLLLMDPPELPKMADRPTKEDALRALEQLDSLLDEFPFVNDASRAVALSCLITPVVRGAMQVAPMHVTSAPVAGSGKSYIIDLAAAISIGQRAPVIAAGRDEAETEKRLVSALFAGQPIISIDNVNGDLGGDFLCQMIERPIVEPRVLGTSNSIRIESRATTFATGNNIRLVGDMTRRVVLCSLDPNVERPELRQFRTRPFDLVLADRGKYVAAALTIARAYAVAGFPNELHALASFEDWSRIVRSALVWLGQPDPVSTMEAARADDPTTTSLRSLLASWYDAVGGAEKTTAEIVSIAKERDPYGNQIRSGFLLALGDVAGEHSGEINSKRLAKWLSTHRGRIIDGMKFVDGYNSHAKQKAWSVAKVG